MKKRIPALLFLLGLFLLLYPIFSSRWSRTQQHCALEQYRRVVAHLMPEGRQRLLEAAEGHNAPSLLAVDESGIIGCVSIPALQTELPLYANTRQEALSKGAGLLEGSSLPLGGLSTHAVLSAHRGLPETPMFRDLDRLTCGDTFTVTVLDQTLTYRVEQILTVSPEDTAVLLPREGEDLCSLLTCTPYGINSHRLVVRGRRI